MATASTVHLDTTQHPVFSLPNIQPASSELTSNLLNKNQALHHIFFNDKGFHNHIVHHLLTAWALDADPATLQRHYDDNLNYQRPALSSSTSDIEALSDPEKYSTYLGKGNHYSTFLSFFQQEIARTSWKAVVQQYLFDRTPKADDLLARMFAGVLHPIIHLGFGIEFEQPSIIAEALAQAAVHANSVGAFFTASEAVAAKQDSAGPAKSIAALIDDIQADQTLMSVAHYDPDDASLNHTLQRGGDKLVALAGQVRVEPTAAELERRTAEMINTVAWFTGAAQRAGKVAKFDFLYMHCVTSSIFFSAFAKQEWLKVEDRARLLEWKIRVDLAVYLSQGAAKLDLALVRTYVPTHPREGWEGIVDRVLKGDDDGHVAKFVRAFRHGEAVCQRYEERDEFRIKKADWLQLGRMALDGHESGGWLRASGFDEAWKDVPNVSKAQL